MSRIVIGAAGQIASGKTSAYDYLKSKVDIDYCRTSDALRKVADIMGLEKNRENLQTLSTFFRETFDQAILSKALRLQVEKGAKPYFYIDGIRRHSDIVHLTDLPNFYLIAIQTDLETRYKRLTSRGENPDDERKTLNQFKADNEQESETQINEVMKEAAFTINNNGSVEEMAKQLDDIIANINAQVKS